LVQTVLRDWAYGRLYMSSGRCMAALRAWLAHCNRSQPNGRVGNRLPVGWLPKP